MHFYNIKELIHMPAKTFKMTAAGKAELEAELEQLKTEGRIDIAEKLKIARSYGDLSENSEYDEAKSEQAKIEARIQDLEYQLDHAVVVESTDKDTVSVGSTVTVIPLYEAGYPRVTHPSAAQSQKSSSEESNLSASLDLHVLSTPPAFILSQDQTLV